MNFLKTLATAVAFCGTIVASAQVEMTLVNGGTFRMGNSFEDLFEDELPVHSVNLKSFYIGTYEVSQGEWEAVMGENPSANKELGKNAPVEQISWFDAIEFCNKLSEKDGLTPCYKIGRNNAVTWNIAANGYRLPTEAEWEFAARGGNDSRDYLYSGGNAVDDVAWHKGNSTGKSKVTGTKRPNELGLFDMSGNVWEWCWDWYSNSYNERSENNPQGPQVGMERCRRGGGWNFSFKSCRISNRLGTPPDMRFPYVGLRLVRNAQ